MNDKNINNIDFPIFLISIDVEKGWGVCDREISPNYQGEILREDEIIIRLICKKTRK